MALQQTLRKHKLRPVTLKHSRGCHTMMVVDSTHVLIEKAQGGRYVAECTSPTGGSRSARRQNVFSGLIRERKVAVFRLVQLWQEKTGRKIKLAWRESYASELSKTTLPS